MQSILHGARTGFLCRLSAVIFYLRVFLCVEVQWFSGGSVRVCACISGPVRNREPLSESNTVRERKRENGLGNEPLFSRRCGYRVSTGRLQQMRQWE